METTGSVVIDRRIDEVFRLTTECVAEWSNVVAEEEVIEKTPEGVGTRFRTIAVDHGRRMEFDGTVTLHEPPHRSVVHLIGGTFDIEADYRFEDLGGQTRVTQLSQVQGKGFFRIFLRTVGWMMRKSSCKAMDKEMQSLKNFCENHPGLPQDS